ncbi:cation diffusion facilitator family transporter [Pseudaeromonas sharmana]|uniref:Cation diffusion facilitator family transporter n=1 Tax=Pseudaeromonas sharmana TaxID=328412 RepID=A0ABV8CLX8_9GAMM
MTTHSYSRLVTLAGLASTATAGILIIAKLTAWLLTGSSSLLASLTDSLMDISASLINLFAIRYALAPADDDHSFGHGKAESLASLAQAAFITGSALVLVMNGFSRLIAPEPMRNIDLGLWVTVGSFVLTLVLVLIQGYVVRRTNSQAVKADRLHYQSDLLFNAGVLLALVLSAWGWLWADGLFAMLLGLYILKGAVEIGYEAVQTLLDRQLPDEERAQIEQLAISVPGVNGVHDLRTRQSGQMKFIQLHLELDDQLPLVYAHALADQAEAAIRQMFPQADIIIHMDPMSVLATEAPEEGARVLHSQG